MKHMDAVIRIYFNTGAVGSAITSNGYMCTSGGGSTLTNTCPLIQSALMFTPSTATGIVTGIFLSKATTTNMFGINLASSAAQHSMGSCRMYYPQIQ